MSDKMLTFEEFRGAKIPFEGEEKYWEEVFRLARQGMIPADNAVVIPNGVDWPVWAKGIASVFTEDTKEQCEGWPEYDGFIHYIPRPKPVWTPKVGEAVFVKTLAEGKVKFGVINKIDGIYFEVYFPDCSSGDYSIEYLKPGKIEHIGKPWDEIPGGIE